MLAGQHSDNDEISTLPCNLTMLMKQNRKKNTSSEDVFKNQTD